MSTKRRIYFYPSKNENQYVNLSQKILLQTNSEIFTFRSMFCLPALIHRKENIFILNWLEDTPYAADLNHLSALLKFLKSIIILFLARLMGKTVIWVKHNFRPHNQTRTLFYFNTLKFLLSKLSTKVVVLEKYPLKKHANRNYIPHPLSVSNNASIATTNDDKRDIDIGFYGHIKPYKNLHEILKIWPIDLKLVVRGHCEDSQYEAQILKIISQRNLLVDYRNAYLDDNEFEVLLVQSKYVLLPHKKHTMISSGVFYHAISFGCNIILSDNDFGIAKSQEFDFVSIFNKNELSLAYLEQHYIKPSAVLKQAENAYSDTLSIEKWNNLLK